MVNQTETTEKGTGNGEVNEAEQPENTISSMRDCGEFLDVDLRCKDGSFGVQKLVLIMHSEYYRRIFLKLDAIAAKTGKSNANACVILEDVEPLDIVNIITYMYEGKVSVMQADIPGFISVAKQLQIEDIISNIPDVEMIQNRSLNLDDTPYVGIQEEIKNNNGQKRALIDSLNLLKSGGGTKRKLQMKDRTNKNQHKKRNCSPTPRSKTYYSRDDESWSSIQDSTSGHTDMEDSDSSIVDAQTTRIYRPASGTWLVKDNNYSNQMYMCCPSHE